MKPVKLPKENHLSIDDFDRGIVSLAARINAATYELLVLVRQFDERAGWLKWGLANCAEWLHWRCDLSMSAAREKGPCSTCTENPAGDDGRIFIGRIIVFQGPVFDTCGSGGQRGHSFIVCSSNHNIPSRRTMP